MDLIDWLLETELWPPRKDCGQWTPALIATAVASELVIALQYICVAIAIGIGAKTYNERSKDGVFRIRKTTTLTFVLIFVSCGISHGINALMFFYPAYRLATAWITVTAFISMFGLPLLGHTVSHLLLPNLQPLEEELRRTADQLWKRR